MWLASLRDLQWRQRRFLIALAATALLFGVTLVMLSLSGNLEREATAAIAGLGADAWVVVEGTTGPISGVSVLPMETVDIVAARPGVARADPIAMVRQSVSGPDGTLDIVLVGVVAGGVGSPVVTSGSPAATPDEIVVDEWSSVSVGETLVLGGRKLVVAGTTRDSTLTGGMPMVFADLTTVQEVVFSGASIVQAVLVDGDPRDLPQGLVSLEPAEVVADIVRPLERLVASMNTVTLLLWFAAVATVGSVVHLTALERTRDFAVLKAVGVSGRDLFLGLAAQAILLTTAAGALSIGIAHALLPTIPVPLDLPAFELLRLIPVVVGVGTLASAASLRRIQSVDPVLAFGSA